ncbi:unnamed protein product [Dovyalis caffra]|uniref:ABC transporter domain-containing protein n=1 Tax=Dovyalis caffra TaxID=77055 RepID=A0AAV1SU70_9ROSI|nr:unnamed protein product [Dovyalis caffra]
MGLGSVGAVVHGALMPVFFLLFGKMINTIGTTLPKEASHEVAKDSLDFVYLVQQEPALFGTSIYENTMYGKEGATEGDVIEPAKLANAHNFISSLLEGYSTKVGERGVQLSGGQKQRVAIARAVLKNSQILLLDDASSALDVESERIVQQALDRLMRNITTVIVAHRLSTIQNADKISVTESGKIIERGTRSSPIENTDGTYFKLVSLQQHPDGHY